MAGRNKPEFRRGRRRRPEASRKAILHAALIEFAREGLAGARMDAIAAAAGVNKALLYYYFGDKEALYGAILDRFFEPLVERIIAVCDQPGPAGERFLAYARTHFDAVAASPYYAHIFMSELMSAGRDGSPHLDRIFARYMQPIGMRVLGLVREGVNSGEFRALDPNQFIPSAIGSIVHWFLTAPLRQKFAPEMGGSGPRAIQQRRAAVLDFIAAALFADRERGIDLAARIAASPERTLSDPVAQRRPRERRPAPSPSSSAPMQPSAPTPATLADSTEPSPKLEYRWADRWFSDAETAGRILNEERKQRAKSSRARRPNPSQKEGPK